MRHPSAEVKPTWRGWIHLSTLPIALVAGIVLIVLAQGVAATVSVSVFVTSSVLMFGISGTYHRFNWSPQTKIILKRLDHANIFLLIAGTYTPIAIKNHGNVLRFGERLNFFENPSAVETIEEAFPHQRSHPSHRTTVVLSEGLG